MAEVLFEVRDLKRWFPSGRKTVKALDGVSFDLCRNGEKDNDNELRISTEGTGYLSGCA